jgi:PEP-CTERM motif
MKQWFGILVVCLAFGAHSPARAGMVISLGVMDTTHNDPTIHWNPVDFTAPSGSAPFDGTFDGSSDTSANLNVSWTFNYVVPAFTAITAASFTIQIYDVDLCTVTPRSPVASFFLAGQDLTSALNTEFNNDACGTGNSGVSGNTSRTGNINKETIVLPSLLFTPLLSGSATVTFTLANGGRGVLANDTAFNGAELLYSELNLTTVTNAPSPEPGTWAMMLAGVAIGAGRLVRRKK